MVSDPPPPFTQPIERFVEYLSAARAAVAFTGAGISTESGIPDFRSPGGVWSRYQPVLYQDFLASEAARCEYWRQKCEAHDEFAAARPNVGHETLARWEASGRIEAVITQNIDELHQAAGSRRVIELHGTVRRVTCVECAASYDVQPYVDAFRATATAPRCPMCGGPLKHATISFGQPLSPDVLREASLLSKKCDLFLAIGSSLVVHPAAGLPVLAKERGARLVILNREPTPLDDHADLVVNAPIGETLAAVDEW